jgi:hypothetical protein
MPSVTEPPRSRAATILKTANKALRAIYVGACLAVYALAMAWIASRRP